MRAQVGWVWGAAASPPAQAQAQDAAADESKVVRAPARLRVQVDPHTRGSDFAGYHRAGWSYALMGLGYLELANSARGGGSAPSQGDLILDSYVDRTFHWGRRTLSAMGHLPYRRSWAGIIHHTFDETHSTYNCAQLLRTPEFLESLPRCVALFALSDALRGQLEAALNALGLPHPPPPVYALTHPTELVPASARFSMARFAANPERGVVQVGAWLRDPYAIHELQVGGVNAPVTRKLALQGREMDVYFAPPLAWPSAATTDAPSALRVMSPDADSSFMCALESALAARLTAGSDESRRRRVGGPCRPEDGNGNGGPCRPEDGDGSGGCVGGPCRPEDPVEPIAPITNKHVIGLLRMLQAQARSVTRLQRLDDAAYDDMLATNVVFLKLDDASAVNTALECAIRGTPLIVNRLPALVEFLGGDYPGFYTTPYEASALASSWDAIQAMHSHLTRLDTRRLSLGRFVQEMEACLADATGTM